MLAFAGVLVLAACGGGGSGAPSTPTPSSSTPGDSGGAVNLEVPELTIEVYQGEESLGASTLTLSELLGQGKPVVLNFWAALCPPCRAEIPEFQRVYEARGHEVTIVGVDIGPQQFLGTGEEGRQLLIDLDVNYPAGTTFDERVVRDFRVVGMPTTFFLYPDGRLLRAWSGLRNEEKINEFIDELLAG